MDKNKFQEIFNSGHIVQDPAELFWLVNLVKKLNPKIVIEIGVEDGGTLKFWEQLLPEGGLLIGIDICDPKNKVAWDWRGSNREIHLIDGNSGDVKVLQKVHQILGKREADFLFIDGEHSDEAVRRDFSLYSGFVRSGGLVGFHDLFEAMIFFRFLTGMRYSITNSIGTGVWLKP